VVPPRRMAQQPRQAEPSRSLAEHRQRAFRTLRKTPAHRPTPHRNFDKSQPWIPLVTVDLA